MTPPLTVVQLLPALESGGVERSTLEIAEALVRAGHRAIVVSAGGRLVPALQATRRRTHRARHRSQVAADPAPCAHAACAVRARARRHRARALAPAGLDRLCWRCAASPRRSDRIFVTTVHGLNSPSRYSAVMTRGERVICVSQTVRDYVLRHYPRPIPRQAAGDPARHRPGARFRAHACPTAMRARLGRGAASGARRRRPAVAAARTRHAPEGPCRCA